MDPFQQAKRLYAAGDMHRALEAAQAAADRQPKDAEAWWLLGAVARHVGLAAASDDGFRRAAALSSRRPVPVRLTRERLTAMVDSVFADLSADGRRRLGGRPPRVESLPAPERVKAGVPPDALSDRVEGEVVLFQDNLENRSGSEGELERLLRRTLQRL